MPIIHTVRSEWANDQGENGKHTQRDAKKWWFIHSDIESDTLFKDNVISTWSHINNN
jgi:hypothetical protein